MPATTMLDDLYRYNDWANGRIHRLCEGLTDAQLDEPREIGFGSLRATLFHILTAEEVWLERWQGVPWHPFPTDPEGISLDRIQARLADVAQKRLRLMEEECSTQWDRRVKYLDSRRNEYDNRLEDLLLHVANHGIYHRAQALHFLKQFGRKAVVGIDYLFYKLAHPTVPQDPAAVAAMRQFGLEVETSPGSAVTLDGSDIRRYYEFHDWANDKVLEAANGLDDSALDHDFQMGLGSIRKTLLHLCEVDSWWLKNWTTGAAAFERNPGDTSLAKLNEMRTPVINERNAFLKNLNEEIAQRIITMAGLGPAKSFHLLETLIQVCGHGTHHRAQIVNMLRRSGVKPPSLDYIVWVRE